MQRAIRAASCLTRGWTGLWGTAANLVCGDERTGVGGGEGAGVRNQCGVPRLGLASADELEDVHGAEYAESWRWRKKA